MQRFLSLVLVLAVIGASPIPPGERGRSLQALTVTYYTTKCHGYGITPKALRTPIVAFAYGFSTHKYYNVVVPVRSGRGPFVVRLQVVPDAYHVGGLQRATRCVSDSGNVAIVLPGHPKSTTIDLAPCCQDRWAASYVAGLVEPHISVRIVRAFPGVECGQAMDPATFVDLHDWTPVKREGNAYYGGVENTGYGTLALEMTRGAQKAYLHLVLEPNGTVGNESSFKRIDVDDALFERALAAGGKLYCE